MAPGGWVAAHCSVEYKPNIKYLYKISVKEEQEQERQQQQQQQQDPIPIIMLRLMGTRGGWLWLALKYIKLLIICTP